MSFFQLQQACLSTCFKPDGSLRSCSSWNQQTASSERSWGESIYSCCVVAEEQVLVLQLHKTFPEVAAAIFKNCVKHYVWMLNLKPVIHCIGECLKLSRHSVFCFSVCFQTLCCTAWAVSTFWFYTGNCSLTHSWWTDRPCRLQVTHWQHSEVHIDVHILHAMLIISDEMSLYFRFSVQSSTFYFPSVTGPARLTRRSKGQMQGDEASS